MSSLKSYLNFKTGIMLLGLLLTISSAVPAEENKQLRPEYVYYEADKSFEEGDYDAAIEDLETLISQGFKNGNVYNNLANAYLKKKKVGKALLNYERARLYMPRNSILKINYRYAKSLMKQQDVPVNKLIILRWLDSTLLYITLTEMFVMMSFFYFTIVLYVIVAKIFKRFRAYSTVLICFLMLISVALTIPLHSKIEHLTRGAIVVSVITDAQFEPIDGAPVHFPLYEGMKVSVLSERNGWYKVKRPDGKIGWIKDSVAEFIGAEL